MNVTPLAVPDVKLIEPKRFGDDRGYFMETWNQTAFEAAGLPLNFVQDNHSVSQQGTLRGLHYQIQHPQGKLVRVAQGEVFDVAVDLRANSPTFGQWVGEYLSEANGRMLWVPPGFAHGFYVVSPTATFLYKCTDRYAPEFERTLVFNDEQVGVQWPTCDEVPVILSAKDEAGLTLQQLVADGEVFA